MTVVWLVDTEGQPATLPDPPAVVLLHFDVPYRHAGHVAVAVNAAWMHGRAAQRPWRLMMAAARSGLVRIARVWPCASEGEVTARLQTIRAAGSRERYCPVCRAAGGRAESPEDGRLG